MVLGFSYGDLLFLMVGTVVLLGPKDLPIVARAAGRLTGKAVGFMQTMRGQVDALMQQSQASQVQKELRDTMAQLDAIRHEIRTGMSIMHPGPLVRENMENSQSRLQHATTVVRKFESTLDRFVDFTEKEPRAAMERESHAPVESHNQHSVEFQRQATSYARFAGHLGDMKSQAVTAESAIGVTQADSSKNSRQIPVLPISAVNMGLFPSREGPLSGGSDLVVEALAERKVAEQALEFLEHPKTSA